MSKTEITPQVMLTEAANLIAANPEVGETIEGILVSNIKRFNKYLKAERLNLAQFRTASKATGNLLASLKVKRLEADRKGGGSITSSLTKEINAGRVIINQSRFFIKETRTIVSDLIEKRNAAVDALRIYYTQSSQG